MCVSTSMNRACAEDPVRPTSFCDFVQLGGGDFVLGGGGCAPPRSLESRLLSLGTSRACARRADASTTCRQERNHTNPQQWLHVPMPPKNHSIQFLFYSPVDELITYVYVIARRATHPTPPVQSPPPLRGSRTAPGARASPVAAAHTPLARRRCDLPDSPWLRPPRCKDRRDDSSVKQGPAAGPCTTSSK